MRRNQVLKGAAFEGLGRLTPRCMVPFQYVGGWLRGPRDQDAPTLMNYAAVLGDPAFFSVHELF